MMTATDSARRDQRHNFIAFGADTVLFSIALLGFINTSIILPPFVQRLGGSDTLVGVLTTVIGVVWSLPQMVAGNIVGRFHRKKPFVLVMALSGRVFVLALAALVALTHADPPWLSLAALFGALMLFLGTDGFATIGWLDMLSRAFPPERRGTAISTWQSITSVGVMAITPLVSFIIGSQGLPFPDNYALLILLGGILFMLSAVGTYNIREPEAPAAPEGEAHHVEWADLGRHLVDLLRNDPNLRAITTARVVFTFGMMAFPFYVLYATDVLKLPVEAIGSFIFAQTIGTMAGSLTLGRIADRYGAERAIQAGSAVILTAPMLSLLLVFAPRALDAYLIPAYVWIYICVGLANNLLFLGFANYTLEIAPPHQRAFYSAAVNTVNSLGVLAPTLGGLLLDRTSFGALFAVTLAFEVAALALSFRLRSVRRGAGSGQPA